MAKQSLAAMITPHPCNKAQEDRNWSNLQTIMQWFDEIININVVNNAVTYNLVNITNLTVTNVTVNNTLTVVTVNVTTINSTTINTTNIDVTNNATFVTINATTINVTTVNTTYIVTYSVTYNILLSVYGGGSPTYTCPTVCPGGTYGTGGGGAEIFEDCCDEIGVPETLNVTITNKTGDCSCLPSSGTMTWIDPYWEMTYVECGGCALKLQCIAGEWSVQTASCAAEFTLVSASCYPFELVFDVDNGIGGTTNCSGTYRVTITA